MHNVNNQSLNVNINKNVVKLLMINVCGLVKRIQYPEFMELIEGYDILCFVETKTDDSVL
jgi:exonuclease III